MDLIDNWGIKALALHMTDLVPHMSSEHLQERFLRTEWGIRPELCKVWPKFTSFPTYPIPTKIKKNSWAKTLKENFVKDTWDLYVSSGVILGDQANLKAPETNFF